MAKQINDDVQFESDTIDEVRACDGGGWEMKRKGGWSFFCPKESPIVPKPGMEARFYGRGIGYIVRGLTLNGTIVFYRTEAEEEARHKQWCEDQDKAKRADFEKNREQMDADYNALPEVLRRRIDKFRKNNPDFRWDFEPYEMFCCKQAVVFFEALKTEAAIRAFHAMPYEEQRKAVPGMNDGHSGNTFECAVALALDLATVPENAAKRYGALAPLVGSEKYGCVPAASQEPTA